MAKKMSPSALRAKAKAMLEQAKLEEDKLYMKIGRLVEKELKKDTFSSEDVTELRAGIDRLKEKISKVLEG